MRFKAPSLGTLRAAITVTAIAAVAGVVAMPVFPYVSFPAAWYGYGGNPQHTGISKYAVKGLGSVKWSVPIDEDLAAESSGPEVLIHYAAPCITSINPFSGVGNTVVIAVHNNIGGNHDSWRVEGLDGNSAGALKWSYNTDYSAVVAMPTDWTSVYPLSMVGANSVVAAGGGATVLYFPNADQTGPVTPTRFCFYTSVANYNSSPSTYKNIKICTPITGDSKGNFFFGYYVTDPTGIPSNVLAAIGTGGVVKFNTAGRFTFRTAASLVPGTVRPPINCAPALSNDGKSVYVGLRALPTTTAYLVKLNASDPGPRDPSAGDQALALQAYVHVVDPYTGANAQMIQESSASPMVAPDGHVFMGVFGSSWRESHGWMLQFDKDLHQKDNNGILYPVGGFGWDDTASVVPASAVPSYTGQSSYLVLSKYNNYHVNTGDGRNHLAILDPSILTVLGATNASPIVVSSSASHGFVDGQRVSISGVLGNTNANGSFYVKVTGYTSNTFALYSNSALTAPVAGNAAYTSGGTLGSVDRQSGIGIMREIALVTGVTCDADYYACTSTTDVTDPSVPVREWCINAAAIDPVNKCAVVNSEDGHAYKWDFVTNTLKQSTYLQPATGEAYTCTVVGPDGTSYAINNGVLHAVVPPSGP